MSTDEITKLLDELGQRLEPTGQYVFGLAVRQVYINAVTAAIVVVFVAAIGVLVGPRVYRWQDDSESYSDRSFIATMLALAYCTVCALTLFYAVDAIPSVLNPEYAAIRDILGHLPR